MQNLWVIERQVDDVRGKEKSQARGLREEDLKRFLEVLRENYPHFYVLALVQVGFGLRIGEAVGLSWEDIDLETGRITIRRAYVKKTVFFRDYPKGGKGDRQ